MLQSMGSQRVGHNFVTEQPIVHKGSLLPTSSTTLLFLAFLIIAIVIAENDFDLPSF